MKHGLVAGFDGWRVLISARDASRSKTRDRFCWQPERRQNRIIELYARFYFDDRRFAWPRDIHHIARVNARRTDGSGQRTEIFGHRIECEGARRTIYR